ncbi:MAG: hypothetical protein Q7S58_19790 [Candidatus Binatus sp.]|uniref:hypothetical protein n=1 Tax=Candidatus Binatus sp. TaxID=2811406 RepID=UPI002724A90D|nr:hypothetical protein [Candidatus Binatus sp.]MDO8434645.1 hypothetical protein [Candidatus Binatus sp.]
MKRVSVKIPAAAMLTHFTRASKTASALDNLIAILKCGTIRGGRRMVGGGRAAVCLFDVPIAELGALLDRRNRRRYEPFGIAIDKRYAFKTGARPVIYLPAIEARQILDEEERWRVVTIDLNGAPPIDWTFEREWRLAGDLVFEPNEAAALVESWKDVDEIFDRFDGRPPCAGVIPIGEIFAPRNA